MVYPPKFPSTVIDRMPQTFWNRKVSPLLQAAINCAFVVENLL